MMREENQNTLLDRYNEHTRVLTTAANNGKDQKPSTVDQSFTIPSLRKLRARLREAEKYVGVQDPKRTLEIAQEVLPYAILLEEYSLQVDTLIMYFYGYYGVGDFDNAWKYVKQIEMIIERYIEFDELKTFYLVEVLWHKGILLHATNNISVGIEVLEYALSICPPDHKRYDRLFNDQAFLYAGQGKHDKAIEILYELIERLQAKGDLGDLLLISYIRIADSYGGIKNNEKARYFSQKGLEMVAQGIGHNRHECALFTILAAADFTDGEFEAALQKYQKALTLLNEFDEIGHHAELRSRISACLINLGRYDEVKEHLTSAYDMAMQLDIPVLSANVELTFAELHKHVGNKDQAVEAYKRAENYLNDNYPEMKAEIYYNLSKLHEECEEYKEAYRCYQQAVKWEESYRGPEVQQSVSNIELKHRLQVKLQEENSQLKGYTDWKDFSNQFEKMYPQFFTALSQRSMHLTPTEMKICALLRLNLSSKDIASMLAISVNTANTHRRSIRRKLNLNGDENLTAYLVLI